jgi:sulfonate transport system permease protein
MSHRRSGTLQSHPTFLALVPKGVLLPLVLLVAWEGLARLEWVSSYVLPSVSSILLHLLSMARSGALFVHLGASLVRVVDGFILGAAIGTVLGLLVGLNRRAEEYLDPFLQGIRSVPSLAWVPLLLLWMGIGEAPKVTLILLGSFFPVYLNVVSGVRSVDGRLVEVGHMYGFGRLELIRRIVIPASLPSVLTGLRAGLAVAWLYVVAAELIAANSGLGFMLSDGRELSRADLIFGSILMLALCGKLTDGLLKSLEKKLLAWRDATSIERPKEVAV